MSAGSALYVGRVTHSRLRPRRHRLAYGVFNLLLDLDGLDALAGRLRLFSHNRFNLLAVHDRDHGDGSGRPLRGQVEALLAQAGIDGAGLGGAGLGGAGGRILLLCMPRLLGYVFNPLSVYFCHTAEDRLAAIVYEVSNTFGQRHSYVIPVDPAGAAAGLVRQSCAKRFYVSPFLDMDLTYEFEVRPPGAAPGSGLSVAVLARDSAGPVIATALAATRRDLTDAGLARALARHPLLTLKVIAGIHWEALRIWGKGVALRRRPPPPAAPATFAGPGPVAHRFDPRAD